MILNMYVHPLTTSSVSLTHIKVSADQFLRVAVEIIEARCDDIRELCVSMPNTARGNVKLHQHVPRRPAISMTPVSFSLPLCGSYHLDGSEKNHKSQINPLRVKLCWADAQGLWLVSQEDSMCIAIFEAEVNIIRPGRFLNESFIH